MPLPDETRSMFDTVAPWYDPMNRRMSLGLDLYWRRRAVGCLSTNPAGQILDVATGTADLALAAARRDGGQIVGVDLSLAMLKQGRAKVQRANLNGRVHLLPGDALALPFPEGTFDAVVNAFLLRNLPDRTAAFAEMARVVRPGGKIVCLEIAYPHFPPWRALFRLYFDRFIPLLGRWLTRAAPAYRYLPHSLARFPPPEEVLAALVESGWEGATARPLFPGTATLYVASRSN